MISNPTVLILGAGSSLHAGYPNGLKLVEEIVGQRNSEKPRPAAFDPTEVSRFFDRLANSGSASIDTFLEFNPQFASIGKYFIAEVLNHREHISNLFPLASHTWYHHLLNSLLVNRQPDFSQSKLSIITFNYDRSLEAFLYHSLINRFDFEPNKANEMLKKIPIVHVHGILGEFPDVPYKPVLDPDDLLKISSGIKIVYDASPSTGEFWNPEFERAHNLLKQAKRIYFVGFGFHPENVERLKFFDKTTMVGKTVRTTYVGSRGIAFGKLQQWLGDHGMGDILNLPSTTERITCDDFFDRYAALD